MAGVVIPANNEDDFIARRLKCVQPAAVAALLQQEPVLIVVVLDACTDPTGVFAQAHGSTRVEWSGRHIGAARTAGAQVSRHAGALPRGHRRRQSSADRWRKPERECASLPRVRRRPILPRQ